jgi:hypothetical protein
MSFRDHLVSHLFLLFFLLLPLLLQPLLIPVYQILSKCECTNLDISFGAFGLVTLFCRLLGILILIGVPP